MCMYASVVVVVVVCWRFGVGCLSVIAWVCFLFDRLPWFVDVLFAMVPGGVAWALPRGGLAVAFAGGTPRDIPGIACCDDELVGVGGSRVITLGTCNAGGFLSFRKAQLALCLCCCCLRCMFPVRCWCLLLHTNAVVGKRCGVRLLCPTMAGI